MTTSAPGTQSTVSPPGGYHDEPPRLCVCINEVVLEPDRKDEALIDEVMIYSVVGADYVSEIATWIVDLLEGDAFSKVWEAPAGRSADWKVEDPNEEAWARQMDAMFLGTAYAGPNITAGFPNGSPYASLAQSFIYKRIQRQHMPLGDPKKFGPGRYEGLSPVDNDDPAVSIAVACQHLTTYGALCRGLSFETDLSDIGIPASQGAGGLHIFDEQTPESGARGTWMGSAPRVKKLPGGKEQKSETIQDGDAHNANIANSKVKGYGPGTIYTYNPYGDEKFRTGDVSEDMLARYTKDTKEVVKDKSDPSKSVTVEHKAGDIVYDRESNLPVIDAKIGMKAQVAAAADAKDLDKQSKLTADAANAVVKALTGQTPNFKGREHEAKDVDVQLKCAACAELHHSSLQTCPKKNEPTGFAGRKVVKAHIPLTAQVDGSHVGMVLRKFTFTTGPNIDKVGIQLIDTSSKTVRVPVGKTAAEQKESLAQRDREYVMFSRMPMRGGIYAGEGMASIERYGGKGKFVGCGSLPPIKDAEATLAHLQKARPVALARLVISVSERPNPKAPWNGKTVSDEDILFVSRAVKAWGDGDDQNYYISRYLLSLRNTPYHKNLQAYWLVFAPRNELAEVMWEQGARALSVDAMITEANRRRATYNEKRLDKDKLPKEMITGMDLAPIAVLTHDEHGIAIEVWRNHCLVGGGQGSPSKGIKNLFIAPSVPVVVQQKKTSGPPEWLTKALQIAPDPSKPKVSDLPAVHKNPLASYVHPLLYDATGGAGIELPGYLQGQPPAAPANQSTPPGQGAAA